MKPVTNKLIFNIASKFGRNRGRISTYHRGGGVKRLFRLVDFWRHIRQVEGKVISIERDPNRSGPIALTLFSNGILCYTLASEGLSVGDYILNNSIPIKYDIFQKTKLRAGSSYTLRDVPNGSRIFNLEFVPRTFGKIARSAGTFCILVGKYSDKGLVKMVSGEYRLFSLECRCSFGRVGNADKKHVKFRNAGTKRRLGRRPIVRGRAMNPVDHPHGGRTNGGITPKTPWGLIAIGPKTRNKKKPLGLIVSRRKK